MSEEDANNEAKNELEQPEEKVEKEAENQAEKPEEKPENQPEKPEEKEESETEGSKQLENENNANPALTDTKGEKAETNGVNAAGTTGAGGAKPPEGIGQNDEPKKDGGDPPVNENLVPPNPPVNGEESEKTAFSDKLKEYLFGDRWTSYLAITVGLIIVLIIGAVAAHLIAKWQAEQIVAAELLHKDLVCKTIPDSEKEKQKHLNEQRDEIKDFSNLHRQVAIKFYGFFYATFTVFSIFGALAAISLAIIARQGIDKASNHLLTVFLVSMAIVILYQSFFGVFQQTKNLDNNANWSIAYAGLADKIDSYCVTGKVNAKDPEEALKDALPKVAPTQTGNSSENKQNEQSSNQKVTPFFVSLDADEFIQYVNWEMVKLKNSPISLDETKFATFDPKKFAATP
jgi:hypothetical protein